MSRLAHPVRYQILAATMTERQRQLLCALPLDAAFDPAEVPELGASLAAMRRDGLIAPRIDPVEGCWLRLTDRGRQVRHAAEAMA